MSAIGIKGDGLDMLVDRHAELCEFFNGKGSPLRLEAPPLIAPSAGKTLSECLANLVDQALAVYEGADFSNDPRLFALKIALTDAILELT
jgi:hypothetical protein